MDPKKHSPTAFEEALAEGLRIQHRFRPEPIYKTTGKGYMTSEGVSEMAAVKKSIKKQQVPDGAEIAGASSAADKRIC